ncbi:MAG: ComEC family competence protein, partial [Bacteroidota bacterium]
MINWRQIPVLRLLIPFMLGIICALHVEVGLPSGTYVIAIYLLGLIIWAIYPIFNTRFSFGYAVQFFLLLWGYHFTHQFHAERCPHYLIADTPAPTFFTGVVHEVPHTQKWIRAVITLQNAGQHTDSLNHGCGQLLAYIEPDTQRATPQYGDRIAFKGNPQRIESPKNPAGFDWRNFYFKENIHHRVFIPKENWQLVSSGHGHPLYTQMISWRLGGIAILRKYLPRASDFSVAAALVLGYKGEMDEEVREAYQTVGATHVLAVSGLHVGLVVWLLRLLLQRIRCYHPAWRYLRSMLLLLAIGLFVLVTGAPPSVCRAALLFSFILVGKDWARQISTYNLLATSAFVLLVYDPYLLLDIG